MSLITLKDFAEMREGKPVENGVLVMDGDWLVYQSMAAAEVETDWGDDIWTLECDHAKARSILDSAIESYRTRKKAWSDAMVVLAFTDDVNWRKVLVDETYKENRKSTRKPVGYRDFLQALWERDEFIHIKEDMLEGDDVMGIIGSGHEVFGFKKAVLVSCDKDFKTIPDVDFLWCTTGNILTQTKETADWWHLFQTIKGDMTDGYSGIPGWGDTAEGFLNDPFIVEPVESVLKSGKNKGQTVTKWVKRAPDATETLWDCIKSIGVKAGMTEQEIIKQGQMARILRFEEYNYIDKEIYLWTPRS
ncbi:putative exonuclease [Klebsiella phage vB_KpnP_Emp27]|uniref:Putative exonuclease n=1 Tax=Klebsiella phage vB_KpnP_Emp27 TaxID=2591364 RepID=A0A5B9NCS1_9CAUD|nr:putative exonuclease [Klebsiella phage vB_KpnP_Emp27]